MRSHRLAEMTPSVCNVAIFYPQNPQALRGKSNSNIWYSYAQKALQSLRKSVQKHNSSCCKVRFGNEPRSLKQKCWLSIKLRFMFRNKKLAEMIKTPCNRSLFFTKKVVALRGEFDSNIWYSYAQKALQLLKKSVQKHNSPSKDFFYAHIGKKSTPPSHHPATQPPTSHHPSIQLKAPLTIHSLTKASLQLSILFSRPLHSLSCLV